MSHYIDFTTNHSERTYGSPIHDGEQPRRYGEIAAVRVDGEPVEFRDETIPGRLHRYLIESRSLRRRQIANDCVAFVAIMNSVKLQSRQHNPFHFNPDTELDAEADDPLVLAEGFRDGLKIPRHIVLPAHRIGQENYLHKLGDDGPLCMSTLRTAMKIMGCTSAHAALVKENPTV